MNYYIYKITNNVNGKIYVGVHKTNDMNDGYMGSGKTLMMAQKKYGIQNFSKEILQSFDNPEDMYEAESKIVNEEFIKSESTYNIKLGGIGGWEHLDSDTLKESRKKGGKNSMLNDRLKIMRQDPEFDKRYRKNCADASRGRKHTEKTKEKMSLAKKGKCKGKKNSQYGTIWICNEKLRQNKKISKNEPMPKGWIKGRNAWNKKKIDNESPHYGKSWYNDGKKSYLLYPNESDGLKKGRIV